MKRWIVCLVCLFVPTAVYAQAEVPIMADVGIFAAGVDPATGGQPVQSPTNYAASTWMCNQMKVSVPPTPVQQNPNEVRIDDPANPTLNDCIIPVPPTVFTSLPFATGYRVAVRLRGATTIAAWSVLSNPFDRVASTAVLPATGVRVRKIP